METNKHFMALQIQGISATELNQKFDLILDKLEEFSGKSKRPTEDKYLTQDEVSSLFNVSKVTLYNWRKKGLLRAYRMGNVVRFKESEVLKKLATIQAPK